jgi:diguanylate cyclase (GGDEF)-like protein
MRVRVPAEALILAAFVAGGVLIAATGWLAVASGRAYVDSDARSDRFREAERVVTTLVASIRAAESGERGYVVTGRTEYLDPWRSAQVDVPVQLGDARRLLTDVPGAARQLDALAAETRQKLDAVRQDVELRSAQGFDAAQRAVAAGDGRESMLRLQARIDDLQGTIARELGAEQARLADRHGSTVRAVTLLGVVLAAVLMGCYAVIAWELRERRRLSRHLAQQANHDPLTHLPNRRFFTDWLAYALAQARRDNAHLGLLYIDIDGFKTVNDRRGHKAGDAVLAEIARRFRESSRESDVLARWGGDEFALAVPHARDGREVAALAQRLIASLTDPARAPIADVPIGASIGVAFFPDDAGDVAGLVAAADDAMYVAKRGGRNRAVFSAVAAVA